MDRTFPFLGSEPRAAQGKKAKGQKGTRAQGHKGHKGQNGKMGKRAKARSCREVTSHEADGCSSTTVAQFANPARKVRQSNWAQAFSYAALGSLVSPSGFSNDLEAPSLEPSKKVANGGKSRPFLPSADRRRRAPC